MLFDFRQEFEARGGLLGQRGRKLETLSYSESLTKSNTKQNHRHICRISPQCNLYFGKTDFNSVNLKRYTPSYHRPAWLINWPSSLLTSMLKVLTRVQIFLYKVHFRNFTQGSRRHCKMKCQDFEGPFKLFLCSVFKRSLNKLIICSSYRLCFTTFRLAFIRRIFQSNPNYTRISRNCKLFYNLVR